LQTSSSVLRAVRAFTAGELCPCGMSVDRHVDAIGEVQLFLKAHSKTIADTLYGLQQQKAPEASAVMKLAAQLNASAAKLDDLIDALPDYDVNSGAVAARMREQGTHYAARAEALSEVADALVSRRDALAAATVAALSGDR